MANSGAVFHGNHMMVGMSLGFLFMSGGLRSFASSKAATAALVISLFPRFPVAPTDNRWHLQASAPSVHIPQVINLPESAPLCSLASWKAATAALVISLFPRFPVAPTDSCWHLQASFHALCLLPMSCSCA